MHESWLAVLGDELEQPYMTELRDFLVAEVAAGRGFYPPADRVFNALALTPFDEVRVVILGQDPYHGAGQAMGLCFSVADDGRPDTVGRARRAPAQRGPDRLPRQAGVTRGPGLGAVHRPGDRGAVG